MTRTLVTGSTGLLGNNVVRELVARGETVRVLVRSSADPRPLDDLPVERVNGDVRNAAEVAEACRDVDFVIHSAAWVGIGWSQLETAREINVDGTRNICAAAQQHGCRLIHVSTVDTLAPGKRDQPASEEQRGEKVPCSYVVSKREAEQVVEQQVKAGLQAVVAHPGFILGPWDWKPSSGRMLLEVVQRRPLVTPTGGCSVCDVRDVAAALLAARHRGVAGRHYILAGHNVRYFDLWCRFRAIAGKPGKPLMPAGPLMRIIGGAWGDWRYRRTGREPDINSAAVAMSSLYHYYTSARAQQELDYRIRPLDETIRAAWDWFVQRGYT